MRSVILGTAEGDARIRAVVLDGSRANPGVGRDIFQDYDVTYIVSTLEPFVTERGWLRAFGDWIIGQTPGEMEIPEPGGGDGSFTFLMLFRDGNRVDLTIHAADRLDQLDLNEWSQILLDKDGRLDGLPRGAAPYRHTPPTAKRYADCCNEFWWVSPYVAKSLWRREIPHALAVQNRALRDMLDLMLTWHIGVTHGLGVQVGQHGKRLERYLPPELWRRYADTYAGADAGRCWQALFRMGDLFRDAAAVVGDARGFPYPAEDDRRVTDYLRHVRSLAADATGVY